MKEKTLFKKLNIMTKEDIRKKMIKLEEKAMDIFMEDADFCAPDYLESDEASFFLKYWDFYLYDNESVFKK